MAGVQPPWRVQSPWRPWTRRTKARMQGGPSTATRRTKLKEHADGYHSGAREIRVKGTITGRRRSSEEETGKQVLRRRSSVEGVDTAQEDRSGARGTPCTVLDEEGTLWRESRNSVAGDAVKSLHIDIDRAELPLNGDDTQLRRDRKQCVMGLNAQVARRLLLSGIRSIHRRVDHGRPWSRCGRGEARDLAGTSSRHGQSAVSMETMDMEDRARMQGGPSTATSRTKLKEHADGYHSGAPETRVKGTVTGPEEEEQCRRS
ncbi:uncharacterized protein UDID_18756 [Ustilago sp. UG-2017a]|nr:uncharacterized protein UDID_18756 [Ustilago sp. UG-2017a]